MTRVKSIDPQRAIGLVLLARESVFKYRRPADISNLHPHQERRNGLLPMGSIADGIRLDRAIDRKRLPEMVEVEAPSNALDGSVVSF